MADVTPDPIARNHVPRPTSLAPAGSNPAPARVRARPPKVPSYRQRRGYDQAIVTLTDAANGRRRDYWLGEYGSAASREAYHRVIGAWEAIDRRLPDAPVPDPVPVTG